MLQSICEPAAAKPRIVKNPALIAIAADLEAATIAAASFADVALDASDVRLALNSLSLAIHAALGRLDEVGGKASIEDMALAACNARMDRLRDSLVARTVPGDSPADDDSFEFAATSRPVAWNDLHDGRDFGGWPAFPDEDLDGHTWEPTPDHVLALEHAHERRYQPTREDWQNYRDHLDGRLTEADHLAAHGCV